MKLKVIYSISILLALYITGAYLYFNDSVSSLKHHTYLDASNSMKHELNTLIKEKKESVLLISVSLSANETIKKSLLDKKPTELHLDKLSLNLKENTTLKNIWFQIIGSDGVSFYRSWTKKRGDNLLKFRIDVAKMIEDPKIVSQISTGKFDMTFKSMVPIYDKGKFIGSIETIAKFNSIAIKMKDVGTTTLVVVDKSYKKQLTHSATNKFVEDYYIANLNPSRELLNILNEESVEKYINIKDYQIDESRALLFTVFKSKDINGREMGYFIMSKGISKIDMSAVESLKDRIIIIFSIILLLVILLLLYLYINNYKNFIEDQNKKLEESVDLKTKELQHLANHDALTGLPNRLLFLDRLEQLISYSKREKRTVGVLFLDLDRFKEVNDTYGHTTGDILLKEVTKRLQESVREADTIARLGGDEFTILLDNISNTNILLVVEKIIEKMQDTFIFDKIELNMTFSIGVSSYPQDGETSDVLLRNADTAMYKAKDIGRNAFQFYDSKMTELAFKRVELEHDIRKAIKEHEFEPYFQPKIDLQSGKVIGVEALIRWNHPIKGVIFPDEFIPFAQEIGLILSIDTYMMIASMKIVAQWHAQGLECGVLSLNVSKKQLSMYSFIEDVKYKLENIGLSAENLELEILESQIMHNPQKVITILEELKEFGVKVSIDDFGTGYSSLTYLKKLPLDKIKIDRSFIMDIPDDKDDVQIVKTIIDLSKNLGLEVIAEGVETQAQADFLIENGCYNAQGYLYSKPISAQECENYIKAKQ